MNPPDTALCWLSRVRTIGISDRSGVSARRNDTRRARSTNDNPERQRSHSALHDADDPRPAIRVHRSARHLGDNAGRALTLRSLINSRGDFLLTTFPTADLTQPALAPVVFPQLVDGGGYRTQFVLLSAGNPSAVTLNLRSDGGTPLAVGK
jgi:hypothetical protein